MQMGVMPPENGQTRVTCGSEGQRDTLMQEVERTALAAAFVCFTMKLIVASNEYLPASASRFPGFLTCITVASHYLNV